MASALSPDNPVDLLTVILRMALSIRQFFLHKPMTCLCILQTGKIVL